MFSTSTFGLQFCPSCLEKLYHQHKKSVTSHLSVNQTFIRKIFKAHRNFNQHIIICFPFLNKTHFFVLLRRRTQRQWHTLLINLPHMTAYCKSNNPLRRLFQFLKITRSQFAIDMWNKTTNDRATFSRINYLFFYVYLQNI